MNIENELKLIPKEEITSKQIIDLLFQNGILVSKEGKLVHQEDTYFDNQEGTLEKQGGSFRIRKKKDKIAVTYKMPIESDTEYKQRKEYEIDLPEKYLETGIDMQTAQKLLQEKYPEIQFPENMVEVVTVINDRNKMNFMCPDGTIVEMAFDTLQGRDAKGEVYSIRPEIEFEIKSGNPEMLTTVFNAIDKGLQGKFERNTLSKYARTKKEIDDMQLTIYELAASAMLSEGLKSVEFSKLKRKGQILHKYDKNVETSLEVFEDFDFLVEVVKTVKAGNFKVPITQECLEELNKDPLLASKASKMNFEIVNDVSLEDMFCLMLSDSDYEIQSEIFRNFLNKNYFREDKATTNRLSHSQQVMLVVGLTCNSPEVNASFEEKITAMTSALFHDIGHVPFSHDMEHVLSEKLGTFGHEANGKRVIHELYEQKEPEMIEQILQKSNVKNRREIKKALKTIEKNIEISIEEHSTKRCAKRGKGIVAQGARMGDKAAYVLSDIRDLLNALKDQNYSFEDLFTDDWIDSVIKEKCSTRFKKDENLTEEENLKRMEDMYNEVKTKIYRAIVNPVKNKDYGAAAANIISSIKKAYELDGEVKYNIDLDIWNFIQATIKQTTVIRDANGLDADREQWKVIENAILTSTINGSTEKAKNEALRTITKAGEGEQDIIFLCTGLTYRQIKGEEPISPKDYLNMREKLKEYIKGQLIYKKDKEISIARAAGEKVDKNEEKEYKKSVARAADEYVESLSQEELFNKYINNMMIDSDYKRDYLDQIKARFDRQLKIEPTDDVPAYEILEFLGFSEKTEEKETQIMEDRYFPTQDERCINTRKTYSYSRRT